MSPKPLPPHLHHERDRHGNPFWTVRRGHGRRARINEQFDSVEFWSQYEAAIKALGSGPIKVLAGVRIG
jgi:hypothetical protein